MLDILGAIFIIIVGTLLHFAYDWTNHNKLVGFFTAVNESTWEHLKLIIAPSFLWFLVEIHFYGLIPIFYFAKFIGMMVMLLIIPLIFYTYTKIFKKTILAVDISSFIIATIVGQCIFHIILNLNSTSIILKHIGMLGLIITFLRYITHTYAPDKNFLHKDPITNDYGIEGHYIDEKEKERS